VLIAMGRPTRSLGVLEFIPSDECWWSLVSDGEEQPPVDSGEDSAKESSRHQIQEGQHNPIQIPSRPKEAGTRSPSGAFFDVDR
jgi:hypothetical protein